MPVAMHSIQVPGQAQARMAVVLIPQHGRTTALDIQDGSQLAHGSDDVQHTAASAVVPLISGAVPVPSTILCWLPGECIVRSARH